MFESLDLAVRSWIAGLTDAALAAADALRAPKRFAIHKDDGGAWDIRPDSLKPARSGVAPASIGRIVEADGGIRIEPPLALARLKGAIVRMEIPAAWVFRRSLDPVSVKTAPYLDGFVRHHIERVTPWRVNDTYYAIATAPLPDDADKMSVEIAVVARDLVARSVGLVAAAGPRRLVLEPRSGETGPHGAIEVPLPSGEGARRARLGRAIGAMAGVLVVAIVAAIASGSWYQVYLDDKVTELDRDIGERKAFLAAVAARQGKQTAVLSRPEALKATEPTIVVLLDTLSSILPDHAYLTDMHLEAKRIRITGISKDVAGLIPVIERSGNFTEVSFFAPTTRTANLSGDRFYIEMRIKPPGDGPKPEAAAP